MFERFKLARKFVNGDKAAAHIIKLLTPSLFLALQPHGGVDPKLMSDEFVIAYVYGATCVCLDALSVTDDAEAGFAIKQVFDRLFPNEGSTVTEFCKQRVIQKNPEFMRVLKLGFAEMFETLKSEGKKTSESLLDHVWRYYGG